MTTAEKKEFDTLINDVNKLKANLETIYRYTQDIPEWARPTIQKLLDKGYLAGNAQDDLNLPESLIRVLVINDRAGLYD